MASEIVATVERRRKWPDDEKLRIIEEALTTGTVAAVADRNGVCRSLLYTWLRLARSGRIRGISIGSQAQTSFVPVQIAPPSSVAAPSRPEPAAGSPSSPPKLPRGRRPAQVEIALTNGRLVKVDECIDPEALVHLIAALDRIPR
ncbi:MAG: transposase [Hyphomicrobiaceae bacterium]